MSNEVLTGYAEGKEQAALNEQLGCFSSISHFCVKKQMVTLSRNSQVATMTSVFTGADESWPMSLVLRSQICSNMDEIQKSRK